MRILILGASGMLGHALMRFLSKKVVVFGTLRNEYHKFAILNSGTLISGVNVYDFQSICNAIDISKPEVIINCVGIVKQLPEAKDPIKTITINSLFPHQLTETCQENGMRLIHYSTDCVFSGKTGNYTEKDNPDPDDFYGRSKLLGEITKKGCLTIRTSLIGREISGHHSLFEWLLRQEGKEIQGYTKTIFSGLTTIAHAKILEEIIISKPELTGLYHVASTPISKYDLLKRIIERFNLNIRINPDDSVVCDRSLNGSCFNKETGISIPSWEEMIDQLYIDEAQYIIA